MFFAHLDYDFYIAPSAFTSQTASLPLEEGVLAHWPLLPEEISLAREDSRMISPAESSYVELIDRTALPERGALLGLFLCSGCGMCENSITYTWHNHVHTLRTLSAELMSKCLPNGILRFCVTQDSWR